MRLGSMDAANQDKHKKKLDQELQACIKQPLRSSSVQCVLFTQIYGPDWTIRTVIKRHYHGNI